MSPLDMNFDANAQLNAQVKAFVQATKDISEVAARIEQLATASCQHIARDVGIPLSQMRAGRGPGGSASGTCKVVAGYIANVRRQGIQLRASVQPPRCQVNAQAQAKCAGTCNVGGGASCQASCRAHANVRARCQPARVRIEAHGAAGAARLLASLQRHLPALIEAQLTLGKRLIRDAQVVARVGADLRGSVRQAGAQALACIGAAADIAAAASVRIQVSVQASASVSGQLGVAG